MKTLKCMSTVACKISWNPKSTGVVHGDRPNQFVYVCMCVCMCVSMCVCVGGGGTKNNAAHTQNVKRWLYSVKFVEYIEQKKSALVGYTEEWERTKVSHRQNLMYVWLCIMYICVCVCVCVCVRACVCVCEFVSTVNRGHTPTLHIQTEDKIANEDGPRFVDTCANGFKLPTLAYRGTSMSEKETITCTGFGPRFSAEKSYTSCVSAILHTKCPTVAGSTSNTHVLV